MNTWLCRDCGAANETNSLVCQCGLPRPSYGQLATLRQALATSPRVSLTNNSTDNSGNNGVILNQPIIHNHYERDPEPEYLPAEIVDAEIVPDEAQQPSFLSGVLSGALSSMACALFGAVIGGIYGYGTDSGTSHSGDFGRTAVWVILGALIGAILSVPVRVMIYWRALTRNRPIPAILSAILPIWLAAYWTTTFIESDGFHSMKYGDMAVAFVGSLTIAAWSFITFIFLAIVHLVLKDLSKVENGSDNSIRPN
jgi:hypothetical protein